MKIFFSHHGKRLLSLALIVCLASQLGVPAFAAEDKPKLLLPTVEVPPEILAGSLFYIKTTDANLAENAGAVYLLPIGRGGDPSGPASVSVRISDMTAKYGSDYLVRFRGKKPLNPPDNESILEIIAESSENGELTESPFVSEEEFADLLESVEDPAIEEPAVEEPVAEPPAEEEYTIEALPAFEETLVPGNPINAAKELYSGRPSDRVPMTTDGDMLTQLQEMADMMTLSVVGATIEVPFAPGESEVFLELEPLDNGDSDGDRSFMVMLSEGYGGTNSALANSLFTITDDEAYRPALFSFTEPVYNEADGEAAVTIAREGAIESTVSVRLATKDAGSAVAGRDYAPVNAEVFFPFGVTERTVKIPVKNQYLPGGGSFYLSLANPAGGEIAGGDAEVILSGSAAALEPEETAVPVKPFATIPDNAASLGTLIRPISYQQLGSVMKMDQNLLTRSSGHSDSSLAEGGHGETISSGLLTVNMRLRNKDARKPITAGQKKTYTFYRRQYLPDTNNGSSPRYDINGILVDFGVRNITFNRNSLPIGAHSYMYYNDSGYLDINIGAKSRGGGFLGDTHSRLWSGNYDTPNTISNRETAVYFDNNTNASADKIACSTVGLQMSLSAYSYNKDTRASFMFWDLTPIMRPFDVTLSQGDPLTFIGNGAFTPVAAIQENGASYRAVTKYTGDKVTVAINTSKTLPNYSKPVAKFQALYLMPPSGSSLPQKLIKSVSGGAETISFDFTNSFIASNLDYITFTQETSGTVKGRRGHFTIKPVYQYIDQTVRVFSDGDTSRDNRGYLQDLNSRTSYNVVNSSYNDYYFHYGDKLNLHTVMNASAAAEYDPTGVSYLTRDSSSGSAKIHEYKFFTNKATNPSNFNVEVALDSPFTELRPLFSQKNNAVTIRVKNSDVRDLLDTGYGFFANARQVVVPPPVTGSASTQTDFIVSEGGKVVNNQLFTVAARLKEGKSGGLKWVDPHTKETFSGNVFFFHAGLTAESNIIELSVDQSSVKPKYYALSGFLFHDARNLLSELKSSPRYPAVGGVINAGASIGLATSGGGFETAPFMALPGTRLRYQIAVDGMNRIAELNIDALASGVAPIRKTITTMVNANTTKSRDEMVTVLNVGVITANAENTQTARFIRSGLYVGNVESHTGSIPLPAAEQIDALPIGIVYVTVADKVQYQMYNSNGTESTATETIQGVNFLICDGENQTLVKKSIPGERDPSDPNRWFVSLEGIREDGAEGYQHGDKVYVQMVTDRRAGELAPDPESAMREPSPELRAIMNRSVYAPVFTGCELHISTVLTPVNQNFNMPNIAESTYSYEPIPLIGKLNFTTTIKSMSFSVQQLADGVTTRLSFGKVRQRKEGDNANTSKNYGNPVSGTDYSKNGFLASLKQKLGEAKNMLTDPGSNQELMGFGAPQWSVAPTVGFFLDFTLRTVTTEDGNTDTRPMLAGGGIFLGIAAGFRLTYYVVVPVVFIPVYFGVEGFFNAMMDMGFTAKTDVSQTDIARREINFGDELDFGSEFIMNASVFLYAGIGINKLLSIKGGFELDADLLIDQEYIGKTEADSPGGFAFSASLKIGIDVFLLTIPFSYKVVDLRFGSFSQSNNTRFMSYPAASPPMTAENLQVNVRSFEGNPSDWTPMTITPYAGFVQSGETTLQKNGYDNPEPQILAFGENDYLMVFLGRDQDGTTTLFYSVYNGYDPYLPEADRWSEPLPVSPGLIGGDFEPHIVDAGGKILITWMNGDGPLTDLASYTGSMEIYAALFDKISRTVGPAERLTDDSMVDYSPRGVYDPMTGDMVVYYLKTLPQGGSAAEFVATMDSTANDCSLCYMLYDGARGEWARDMYFPNEIADPLAAAELIKSFGGQRFVLSPIPGYADPLIVDFAAVEHGGFAAYAFTVDMDNNKSTVEDRELYLQLYEFASHKTYLPFRVFGFLAEGETIQYESLPQFASNGSETYLFWVENENNLLYLDIGGLLSRDGETGELLLIDINGQPRTTDDEGSSINAIFPGTVELYEADGSSVRSQGVESTNSVPIGSYVPQVSPKGDLYVIWNAIDTEGWTYDTEDEYSVELYATALIKTELLAEVRPEEGVEEPITEPGPVEVGASSWAPINQLTFNGHHNRDHVFAVSERGDMMVIHNKFLQTYTDDVNNPVAIRDLSLAATVFHPDSSIEVRDIAFSNTYPAPGETITVTANLINYGLTAARDYRAEFYGFGPGTVDQGVLVHTYDPEDPEPLLPGQSVPVSFSLSVPLDNIAGYIVMGYGSEYVDGWIDDWDARGHSEPLMQEARYEVRDVVHTQRDSSLLATLTVENTGNIPGSGLDVLYAEFRGPYMSWKEYGLSEDELEYASEAVGVLAPGESREITLELLIPPQGFEFFGFMDISYTVRDNARQSTTVENEGLTVSEEVVERFHLDAPFAITLNIGDGMVTNTIPARVGNTYALSAEYWPVGPFNSGEVLFGTDDPSIAHVRDGKLVAVASGSTNLNVVIAPYGLHADFPITVTGVSTPPPPVNPPYTPDIGGTLPALTVSVNGGAVSVAFSRSGSDVKLTLPESKLNEIIRSSANGLAVFNLAAQTNAKSVSFDVNTAQTLSAANVSATLRLPAGELTLSPDALASLAGTERLGVTPVTVEISKAESLTKLQEARVRDYNAPVSIAVFVGNTKSDVQGSVSLPYTLKEGADPRAVSVWSLSASGRLTRLTGAYSGGMVTFTTSEERLYTAGIDPVALWDNIFIDISPTDWFYDAVAYANYYGYVDGDNSSRYKPFDTFSRATFATLIWKLEGKPNGHWAKDNGQFIDVPVGLWYSDAVCWAAEQGIVTGTGNGFNPSKLISRQEMVTMLYNYLTYKGVSIPDYQDARYTGADAWAAEAVNALGAAGVLNNIIDGNTLEPERNAIRAELAQLFKDYLTLIAE